VSGGDAYTPYSDLPDVAFWRRSVRRGEEPNLAVTGLIARDDRVMSAGSCFAANVIPALERGGIEYVRTESLPTVFRDYPEHLGYGLFSAAYGNIYTARQFRQLLERALGRFAPVDDRERMGRDVIDLLRPGLRFPAMSEGEFDALTQCHLDAVVRAIQRATVLVFTLGLTEAWASRRDGTVYPAVPGAVGGRFDGTRFEFVNFRYDAVAADIAAARVLLREVNPDCRLILTVSPVPLVATASGNHVLVATTYSKSVLRAAAGDLATDHPDVEYFPAYELVTGPQTSASHFEADARTVGVAAIDAVMAQLLGIDSAMGHAAGKSESERGEQRAAEARSLLSQRIVEAECEEALLDAGPDS
jgi:hypothetical protein